MEEIKYFKSLHGGSTKNIITLIAEGEPSEVFPPELCCEEVTQSGQGGQMTRHHGPAKAHSRNNHRMLQPPEPVARIVPAGIQIGNRPMLLVKDFHMVVYHQTAKSAQQPRLPILHRTEHP